MVLILTPVPSFSCVSDEFSFSLGGEYCPERILQGTALPNGIFPDFSRHKTPDWWERCCFSPWDMVISFSTALCWVAQLCPTLCDPMGRIAHQAPRSTGFSRPEYRSGLPCPLPGNLPHPGLNSGLLHCGWALYHLSPQGRPGGGLPTSVPFSPVAQSCLTLCDPVEWISPLLVLHPEILTAYHSQIDPNTFSLSLPKSLWFFLPLGSSSFPFA